MSEPSSSLDPEIAARIADGRTDLVLPWLAEGGEPAAQTADGTTLLAWCAYYGDVSAVRTLVAHGQALAALGADLGLNAAAFHGHWRLCEYLLEQGADANAALAETGETPLHAALSASHRRPHELVVEVLLDHGASPHAATRVGVETGAFMRDSRTRGETPLHRAAAFASEGVIGRLLLAGAALDGRDAHGDTPLSWASWHRRPDSILRQLCYGDFRISPQRRSMEDNLLGRPRGGGSRGGPQGR